MLIGCVESILLEKLVVTLDDETVVGCEQRLEALWGLTSKFEAWLKSRLVRCLGEKGVCEERT